MQHDTFLSDKQISSRYNISRATVWRWVQENKLPTPYHFTVGTTRWKLSDLEKWEAEQEAK